MNYEPKQPMMRLFRYLKKFRSDIIFATNSSITNKVLDLMPPLLVGWIIDTVSGNTPLWIIKVLGNADAWTNATFIAFLVVLIFGLESFFEWLYKRSFMRLAQKVQHDLRMDAYNKLQSREIAYFEEQRTGNLMSILNNDINQLERFLNTSFNDIVQLLTLFIFATFVLWNVSWELALIGMLPIPCILIGSFFYQKKIAPRYQKVREAVGHLSSRLENNISGILVIKSFTAEKFESQRVEAVSNQYKEVNYDAIKLSAAFVPLIRMFIAIGLAAVMLIGSYWILSGNGKLTVGELTFFAMMIQRILWPVTRLGQVFDEYERARASARRVFGLMDAPNAIPDPTEPQNIQGIQGSVHLDKVSFSYHPDMPILHEVDLPIKAGETIGLAGTTGAGKTTLIKLLLRLYDVDSGSIKIDGIDIRQINKHELRRHIGLVSQDVYLFHGSIFENIAYGMDAVTEDEVVQAATQAQLHDFIISLPNSYQTLVGERGIKLSGGQRQRLSIARAILKNAPILILDEATSSVDTETERAIQENLHQLTQGRTALIIAHRLSTIRHANRIIILSGGGIVEQGTHEDLLQQNGIYADLWNVQIGEGTVGI